MGESISDGEEENKESMRLGEEGVEWQLLTCGSGVLVRDGGRGGRGKLGWTAAVAAAAAEPTGDVA